MQSNFHYGGLEAHVLVEYLEDVPWHCEYSGTGDPNVRRHHEEKVSPIFPVLEVFRKRSEATCRS